MKKTFTITLAIVLVTFTFLWTASAQGQTIIRYLWNLLDVQASTRPTAGHVLYGDGSKWTNIAATNLPSSSGQPASANLTNWSMVQTNSVVFQNGNASNLFFRGYQKFAMFTNVYDTTNITINITNGPFQTVNMTSSFLVGFLGNEPGTAGSGRVRITNWSGGTLSIYLPSWVRVASTNGPNFQQVTNLGHAALAYEWWGTNVEAAVIAY